MEDDMLETLGRLAVLAFCGVVIAALTLVSWLFLWSQL